MIIIIPLKNEIYNKSTMWFCRSLEIHEHTTNVYC